MRRFVIVLLCVCSARIWAEQLFIPVDEQGKPLEQTPATPKIGAEPEILVKAEDPAAKVVREAREGEYALSLTAATQAYVDCLSNEKSRLLGPDFEKCSDARAKLSALYPADKADNSINCVEGAVLGKPRNAGAPCHVVASGAPRDTSNERRWK